jgi:hypothetical protein
VSGQVAQVVVVGLEGGLPPVRVEPRQSFPAGADEWTGLCEEVWREQLETSEHLHDGPIWSVVELRAGLLSVRAERYKRLCVQVDGRVGDLGVRVLGVKGLLTGLDAGGVERVLIARRGAGTRVYQGLWEIAPGGGVDVRAGLSHASISAALRSELREELGAGAADACAAVEPAFVAAVIDPIALSVDLIGEVAWPGVVDARAGAGLAGGADEACAWEYDGLAWVSREELAGRAGELTPPTRSVLRWRGWLDGRA